MEKLEKIISKYYVLTLMFFCLPVIWALFVPGFYGASDEVHIAWLSQMDKAIGLGQIPPRFVPDLSYKFGYPLFNFVFPLPYYIGEVFHFLGLNFVDSVKAVFFISIPLSIFFMYWFLRSFCNSFLALAGSVLYIYSPYRSVDLYVRGAIGEIVAFVFFPLIGLSILRLITSHGVYKKNQSFYIGLGGVSFGLLILSHNIAAYMFLSVMIFFVLIRLFLVAKNKLVSIINTGRMLILGLLISVYFWLPALLDSSLMKYDTVFNYQDHFPTLAQLVKPYWGYGGSVPGPGDGMSFFLGVSSILLIILASISLIIRRKKIDKERWSIIIWAFSIFLVAIFLMNYRSDFFWSHIPLLPYFQFPWRFLTLTTFSAPILMIVFNHEKYKNYLALSVILLTVLINSFYFRPQDFLGRTDTYFLNKYIPATPLTEAYKQNQEEYLRLPKKANQRPIDILPRFYTDSQKKINFAELNSLSARSHLLLDQPTLINYNKYNFPGWRVKIDNKRAPIESGLPYGQISFVVPSGNHLVEVDFTEEPYKKALDFISLIFLLFGVYLILGRCLSNCQLVKKYE